MSIDRLREAAKVLRNQAAPVFAVQDHVDAKCCTLCRQASINLALADWLDHDARVREQFPFCRSDYSGAVAEAILGGAA